MNSRKNTLQERVAKAQQRMAAWDPQLVAAMQLQGAMPRNQPVTVLSEPATPANKSSSSSSGFSRSRA